MPLIYHQWRSTLHSVINKQRNILYITRQPATTTTTISTHYYYYYDNSYECCYHHYLLVVVVSGMQLLRLRSTIGRPHPPQRAVLSQICCFRECKVVLLQILLDGAQPRDARTTWLSSPVRWRETNRILFASALSSMHIICPNRVSLREWIIAVSLGCFVSLCTSSLRTNWYHLMPSSIRRQICHCQSLPDFYKTWQK